MGTRGYVVIKVGRRCYAFYSPGDSYPSALGWEMMELVVKLVRQFAGDIQGMCEFIKTQLSMMSTVVNPGRRTCVCWSDCDVIDKILNAKPGDVLDVEMFDEPHNDLFIEYIWTLNFDFAELTMTSSHNNTSMRWSMKHLYRYPNAGAWAEAVDQYMERRDRSLQQECRRNLFAAIIQTWWRRLQAQHRAFAPETGLLFQLAKRRFEAAQGTA